VGQRIDGSRFAFPPALLSLVVLTAALCAALPASGAASLNARAAARTVAAKTLVVYTVAESEQFLNTSDDRARGEGNNPFGKYTDTPAQAQQSGNGPFPGDESFYSFNIYSNPSLKSKIGVAVFSCVYNFAKDGFCDATFQLQSGTLIGDGAFNFNAKSFALAVTGGYGTYTDLKGSAEESPTSNHAQRYVFTLG
jgi:hypothetical protein